MATVKETHKQSQLNISSLRNKLTKLYKYMIECGKILRKQNGPVSTVYMTINWMTITLSLWREIKLLS